MEKLRHWEVGEGSNESNWTNHEMSRFPCQLWLYPHNIFQAVFSCVKKKKIIHNKKLEYKLESPFGIPSLQPEQKQDYFWLLGTWPKLHDQFLLLAFSFKLLYMAGMFTKLFPLIDLFHYTFLKVNF